MAQKKAKNGKTINALIWPDLSPGAYICPLMRYLYFGTIFGLALQQSPSAGRKFTHTLIWPNLTLFWKKKMKFEKRSGGGGQNGPKWPQNGPKWPNNKMYDFGMIYLLEKKT